MELAVRETREDFSSFADPHRPAMVRLARRLSGGEADDVVQDALVRAWRKRHLFDPDRGTPQAWLLAIVAEESRRTRRRRRATEELVDRPVVDPPRESDVDLERAIRRLAPRQRLAVELHYFVGLSVAETATVMSCAEGTVKSTLSDARHALHDQLGDN
jgi:RNA polymerase sigma-70 factor (ECF subfamily)